MSSANSPETRLPDAVVATFSTRPEVTAIALGGSRTGGGADGGSDYDVYVFTARDIPRESRRKLGARFDQAPEVGNTWFGEGDEWTDRAKGVPVDLNVLGPGLVRGSAP